jgi:hypothetical protein
MALTHKEKLLKVSVAPTGILYLMTARPLQLMIHAGVETVLVIL